MHTESGAWRKFDLYLNELTKKDSRIEMLLKQLNDRDEKLFAHSRRVAQICFGIISHLSRMGIITRRKELVRNLFVLCGLLHDIGIPLIHREILEKFPDDKTRSSFIQRFHPFFSYQTLLIIHPDIADIVYFHHRTDAEKYPKSRAGPDNRLLIQHYDPLTDTSVIFPITFLTLTERQELCCALTTVEYFVENIIDKNISVEPAVFEKISSIFPRCQNAVNALRALFLGNQNTATAAAPAPKPAPTPKPTSPPKPAPPAIPKKS